MIVDIQQTMYELRDKGEGPSIYAMDCLERKLTQYARRPKAGLGESAFSFSSTASRTCLIALSPAHPRGAYTWGSIT